MLRERRLTMAVVGVSGVRGVRLAVGAGGPEILGRLLALNGERSGARSDG
jgi:hypothetical protein